MSTARLPATRPPDRKEAILRASATLFAQKGFAAVGIDDIGAAVGITGPAIYRHFPGKDAVLTAVILSLLDEFVAGAKAVDERMVSKSARGDLLAELVATAVAVALSH